jgi:hypothetical protein
MTVCMDDPVLVGSSLVAVISQTKSSTHHALSMLVAHGHKCPLAILIRQDKHVLAFDVLGREVPLSSITALCPKAIDELLTYIPPH